MATFGAGGGGLFGASSASTFSAPAFGAQSASGGLFGATPQQQTAGASPFGAAPASAGGMFGGNTSQSLFGSGGGQSAPAMFGGQSAPSMFGAASAPAAGGFGASSASLFGGRAASAPVFGASSSAGLFGAASSSSLFGGSASTSLFGGSASTSLFGGSASTSLFGQKMTPTQPGLFGTPATQSAGMLSSGLSPSFGMAQSPLGQPGGMMAQQVPAPIPGSTPFSHLPEDLKGKLLALEKYIKEQRLASARLGQKLDSSEDSLHSVKDGCDSVARVIAHARNELERDKVQAEQLKIDVRMQLKYAEVASVTLESARQSDTNARLAQFLNPYFRSVLENLELRANDYKRDVDEIEEYLRAPAPSRPKAQAIEDILKRLHDYFLVIASQMGAQHEVIRQLKEDYLVQLRLQNPDSQDPFKEAAKKEAATKIREEMTALNSAEAAFRNLQTQVPGGGAAMGSPGLFTNTAAGAQPVPGGAGLGSSQGQIGLQTPGSSLFQTPLFGSTGDANSAGRNTAVRRKR